MFYPKQRKDDHVWKNKVSYTPELRLKVERTSFTAHETHSLLPFGVAQLGSSGTTLALQHKNPKGKECLLLPEFEGNTFSPTVRTSIMSSSK